MSDEAESQEPTMEEILASIRRIISEDDEGEGADSTDEAPAEAAPEPETASEPEDEEVMELTDMIVEEPAEEPEAEAVVEPEPEIEAEPEVAAEPEAEPEPEVEPEEVMEVEVAPEPAPEPVAEEAIEDDIDFGEPMPMAEPEPEAVAIDLEDPTEDESSIISGVTEDATAAAFGELASSMLTSDGESRTLEALVSDMLRPMLKDWMDKNLPNLVEQMVREEIERVARRGR